MEKITVELGYGDCPCCHKYVGSKKMVFVESGAMCLDYEICIKCYDKIHLKVMKVRNLNTKNQHCTQCEIGQQNLNLLSDKKDVHVFCSNCKEKDCVVSSDGTCAMIRNYLSLTAAVNCYHSKPHKFINGICDTSCGYSCEVTK